jgi:hypothetical protein
MSFKTLAPILLTLILLGVGGIQKYRLQVPGDAEPYMLAIQQSLYRMPMKVGTWLSKDEPVQRAARAVLKPNAILSRSWFDAESNLSMVTMLVHCGDGRDMWAHYPPICYVMNGQRLTARDPMTIIMGDVALTGIEYEFTPERIDAGPPRRVFNVILQSDNVICADMPEMRKYIMSNNTRLYGAGQIQVIVRADLPDAIRKQLYTQAVAFHEPTLRTILAQPASFSAEPPTVATASKP